MTTDYVKMTPEERHAFIAEQEFKTARFRRIAAPLFYLQIVLNVVILLAVMFSISATNRAATEANRQLIRQVQDLSIKAHNDLIDHRFASRCHERQTSLDLDYIMQLIAKSQHSPLPPDIVRGIEDIPPANIGGIDCKGELTDPLPHATRRETTAP